MFLKGKSGEKENGGGVWETVKTEGAAFGRGTWRNFAEEIFLEKS